MKNLLLITLMILNLAASAQKKLATQKKSTPTVTALKNLTDSASYAIGMSVANFYAQQGITQLNSTVVAKAIADVLNRRPLLLNNNSANEALMRCMNEAQTAKARPNIAAGEKFLAANRTRSGVKTTASGLQYEIIREGSGPKPTAADTVVAHYSGKLLNGVEFENSYKSGEPLTIPVSRVIKGWTEALQLMPSGSKYRLYIPYYLAYGLNDTGSIPAGSTLIFEVELLEVKRKR
ncbi:MAG: FKBP-type peptidyl-prolyl cis-trans isomerase [Chitinophagaceae bacterium]|nr:FKBP-type peptidyl-prolyl cis-trans isomerase [Chitinophagaceae bacterium]